MEEAAKVLRRLERIEALDRDSGAAGELLGELRALLHEAEEWARAEGGDAGAADAVERLRRSLQRDMIVV